VLEHLANVQIEGLCTVCTGIRDHVILLGQRQQSGGDVVADEIGDLFVGQPAGS